MINRRIGITMSSIASPVLMIPDALTSSSKPLLSVNTANLLL